MGACQLVPISGGAASPPATKPDTASGPSLDPAARSKCANCRRSGAAAAAVIQYSLTTPARRPLYLGSAAPQRNSPHPGEPRVFMARLCFQGQIALDPLSARIPIDGPGPTRAV